MGVIYRLSVEDFFPGGLPWSEGRRIAIWAAEAGADALHVTAGHYRSLPSAQIVLPPMSMPDAPFLEFAAGVKHGGAGAGDRGRAARRSQDRDRGGHDRPGGLHRARAHVDRRSAMGREARRQEPIRRCLACNTCINEMRGGAGIGCVVNGAAGRETLFADAAPPRNERIAVIGAGPAGLTYASLVRRATR